MGVFTDQIAVVTGASSGIGSAIARELAKNGATICLVGRRLDALDAIAKTIQKTSPASKYYAVELAQEGEIQQFAQDIQNTFNRVDILVHSAGVFSMGSMEATPVSNLDWQYAINVRAPYCLTQALLPALKRAQGQIVFINSSVGLQARATVGVYAATKHALRAIADSLRAEVNPAGVRVLSLYLGRTATPMQEAACKIESKPYLPQNLLQPEDIAAVVINALSLPRSAEVTDIHIRPQVKPTR
ncbi:SDR family oxidoreductase [Lusitaniella coriacea]|uniref:SDR family oxidoreductase n=1 Tax=Lusitaniella coriacea TaxID=1983105 RepID=UPI003CF5577C